MNRIQKIFEQLVGFTEEERRRLAFARQIFAARGLDLAAMDRPACWRRKARVTL